MKELEDYRKIHGQSITLGSKVKVAPSCSFAIDWGGEFIVIGLDVNRSNDPLTPGSINVTIGDDWSDGGTDGWSLDDLVPANQP